MHTLLHIAFKQVTKHFSTCTFAKLLIFKWYVCKFYYDPH